MSDNIFNRTIEALAEYKPLPVGDYLVTPTEYKKGESAQKKTPFVKITFRIQEALSGQDVEGIDFKKVRLTRDFYLTDGAFKILNDTINKGLGTEAPGMTLGEALEAFMGSSLVGTVDVETNQNTGKSYRVLKSFRKAA